MAVEWMNSLFGGALISLSLFVFAVINNIAFGVGDMLKNTLEREASISWNNQILFLIGLIISPVIFTTLFYPVSGKTFQNEPVILMIAGLLVGVGYKLCNGGLITRIVLLSAYNLKASVVVILLFLIFGGTSQLSLMFLTV